MLIIRTPPYVPFIIRRDYMLSRQPDLGDESSLALASQLTQLKRFVALDRMRT